MLELQGTLNITTIFMHLVVKLNKNLRCSFKAGFGNLRPSTIIHPAAPLQKLYGPPSGIISWVFPPWNILCCILMRNRTGLSMYFMSFFPTFVTNSENQELMWLKLHNLPSISNFINSEGNGIVGRKLVRPARPCRVIYSIFSMPEFLSTNFCDGLEMKFASPSVGIQQAGAPETAAKSATPCFTFG